MIAGLWKGHAVGRVAVCTALLGCNLLVTLRSLGAPPDAGQSAGPVANPAPAQLPEPNPSSVPTSGAPNIGEPAPSSPGLAPVGTETAAPDAMAAYPQCIPNCREGYLCFQGRCISPCNPPCPADQACTSAGTCVEQTAPAEAQPSLAPAEDTSQSSRMKFRQSPRLTLHGMMTVSGLVDAKLAAIGATGAVGYRQNFAPQFGLHIRVGAGIAGVFPGHDTSSDITSKANIMTNVYGEVVPFAGPLGRFYLGPIVWASYFHFANNPYRSGYGLFALPDAVRLGGGLDMGMLALAHEQLDINWRLKSTFNNQMPFSIEMGIGYHFFL